MLGSNFRIWTYKLGALVSMDMLKWDKGELYIYKGVNLKLELGRLETNKKHLLQKNDHNMNPPGAGSRACPSGGT